MTELQQCFNYVKLLQTQGKTRNLQFLADSNEQLKLHFDLGKIFNVHLSNYRLGIATSQPLTKDEQEETEAKYQITFIQRNYGNPICVLVDEKWNVPSLTLLQYWCEYIIAKEVVPAPPPPQILSSPSDISLTAGVPHYFNVSASGIGFLRYQWYKNQEELPFKVQNYCYIPSPTGSDVGSYYVKVYNEIDATCSPNFNVQLHTVPPQIVNTFPNISLTAGIPHEFIVETTGIGSMSYQWYKNDATLQRETMNHYFIASPSNSNTGSYYVKVLNDYGTVNSNTFVVDVHEPVLKKKK